VESIGDAEEGVAAEVEVEVDAAGDDASALGEAEDGGPVVEELCWVGEGVGSFCGDPEVDEVGT